MRLVCIFLGILFLAKFVGYLLGGFRAYPDKYVDLPSIEKKFDSFE
jgi:hypothetical protein